MNRITTLLFSVLISLSASALTVQEGAWKIEFSDNNGEANIYKNNVLILPNNSGVFKIDDTNYALKSDVTFIKADINESYTDLFGSGKRVDLRYTQPTAGLNITHTYYLYSSKDYILTELKIESLNTIASNYTSPLTTTTTAAFLPAINGTSTTLIVPYDNDAWVRYSSNIFRNNTNNTSYEVGCFYSTNNNNGLVVGSIEHDNWKTGVVSKVYTPNQLISLTVYGGISNNFSGSTPTTRDQLPHGKVKGKSIKSPKVMIGFFEDWRIGMETYGEANAIVAPKLPWSKGTPFGWNSWGNAQSNVSYAIAGGVSAFYANQLFPEFSNDSTVYIGLDSYWDRLTDQNRRRFVNDCKERGQKAGIYWTPFVDWNGSSNRTVEGTNDQYTYGDIQLKINGKPAAFPGGNGKGWALDPTHPGTKMRINYYIDKWKREGYEYLKIDFMTHGTFEGDSWYDPEITTGIQAYNQGMKYLSDRIDGKMYINLSIAPLFPAQYANGRRYACDTYGSMNDTQYALNALTHSWWTDRIYAYNDPDYMVFGQFSGSGDYPSGKSYALWGLGENRARYTSVVTSGLCLLGDDFVNCPEDTRTRAKLITKNPEINRIARIGKSFKPVISAAWNSAQSDLFMNWVADTLYIAAYHFTTTPVQKTFSVNLSDIGLTAGRSYTVHELWSNTITTTEANATTLTLKVPRADARIFKIYFGTPPATIQKTEETKMSVFPNPCNEKLYFDKKEEINPLDIKLYSIAGQMLMSLSNYHENEIDVHKLNAGPYLLISTDTITQDKTTHFFVKN